MTANGFLEIALLLLAVLAVTKPLGAYFFRVFEGDRRPLPRLLGPVEWAFYRLCGIDPTHQQGWKEYTLALLAFSAISVLFAYAIQRLQHLLPFNPEGLPAVSPASAFNTAVSFSTNTDWQGYAGETTMSYFSQMAALTWQNFVSAAAGIGVALALSRGLTRRPAAGAPAGVGNFWVDMTRATLYVLLPSSFAIALFLVSQGVIQNLHAYVRVDTLDGGTQTLAMGPAASQIAIKQLGTNGGGFFNANSAHPFENPTPLTNFVECFLLLAIAAAQTYMYGCMARDQRQGWTLFAAMGALLLAGTVACYAAEAHGNPALAGLPVDRAVGNLEGKEVRFGVAGAALWTVATTAASNGSVNSMLDSYTPLGGLVPLVNILLGEVVFGGAGAGLYGMLVFVLLAVFIAGLMVGRTPEYLGKKIEEREIKLAMLYVLIFPLLILGFAAPAAVLDAGLRSLGNAGPHGLTEILYAFSSAAGNNGSAFTGLNADTLWYNTTLGITMLAGRFLMIVPLMAIAGSMVEKRTVPPSAGTFPTNGPLFAGLLVGVIVIVGALTFFPALSLGPIAEHFVAATGQLY